MSETYTDTIISRRIWFLVASNWNFSDINPAQVLRKQRTTHRHIGVHRE